MDRDRIDHLVAGAALGNLSAGEASEIEAAAGIDPGIRRQIDGMRAAIEAVALGAAPARPPDHLRARVLDAVGRDAAPATHAPWRRIDWTAVWALSSTMAAAAAIVVAVLVGGRQADQQEQIAELTSELTAQRVALAGIHAGSPHIALLKGMDGAEGAWGRLMAGTDGQAVMLVVDGLAPPPPGKTYQLWLVRASEEQVNGGLFVTDADGQAVMVVHVGEPMSAFVAAGVTKEPMTGSAGPTERPMLFGPLQ